MFNLNDLVVPVWVKVLAVVVLMAAVIGTIYAYGRQQYGLGVDAENARWQDIKNTELVQAIRTINRLNQEKKDQEAASEKRLADMSTEYLKEQQDEKEKSTAVIADLRNGNAGLFYQLSNREYSHPGGSGQAGAGAGGGDGETEAQLPPEIAAALYAEADRADGIVLQLGLCQQVIIEDRKLCGKQ